MCTDFLLNAGYHCNGLPCDSGGPNTVFYSYYSTLDSIHKLLLTSKGEKNGEKLAKCFRFCGTEVVGGGIQRYYRDFQVASS